MLGKDHVIAFVATTAPDRAKNFYGEILGLRLLADTPVALEFDAGGTTLRIAKVEQVTPPPYTVLGWKVDRLQAIAADLKSKGVTFERYDGMRQDELGIWTSPDGHQVSWFKDPDGNTLSLAQLIPEQPKGFQYKE